MIGVVKMGSARPRVFLEARDPSLGNREGVIRHGTEVSMRYVFEIVGAYVKETAPLNPDERLEEYYDGLKAFMIDPLYMMSRYRP